MDEQSGEEGEKDEVMGEGIGESEIEKLVPEWGWRRDRGSDGFLVILHSCCTSWRQHVSQWTVHKRLET